MSAELTGRWLFSTARRRGLTRTYLAVDRSVAVDIQAAALDAMVRLCAQSGHFETGGVLIGRYSEFGDRVVVNKVTGPPRDSRRFRFSFIRGIAGLTSRFRREWAEGAYYVGEWHFHPFASPMPSATDIGQINAFAAEADLRCPRPVLVVLGGDPEAKWSIAAGVVMDGQFIDLPHRP